MRNILGFGHFAWLDLSEFTYAEWGDSMPKTDGKVGSTCGTMNLVVSIVRFSLKFL